MAGFSFHCESANDNSFNKAGKNQTNDKGALKMRQKIKFSHNCDPQTQKNRFQNVDDDAEIGRR